MEEVARKQRLIGDWSEEGEEEVPRRRQLAKLFLPLEDFEEDNRNRR